MKFEKHIKLFVPQDIYTQIRKCAEIARPNEACGFLFGDIRENKIPEGFQYEYISKKFDCFESNQASPVHFLMNNLEEFNRVFEEKSQKYQMKLISIFHSHPSSAKPSGFDFDYMTMLGEFTSEIINLPKKVSTIKKNFGNFYSPQFKYTIWTIMDGKNEKLNGFLILRENLTQIEVIIEK